jgi:hypothetical protein
MDWRRMVWISFIDRALHIQEYSTRYSQIWDNIIRKGDIFWREMEICYRFTAVNQRGKKDCECNITRNEVIKMNSQGI